MQAPSPPSPRLAVITPARNAASTLAAALESVLTQDVPAEVIVVDDASTDDTVARARHCAERHPGRVTVLAAGGDGPGLARNVGVASTQAEYVLFLDADDVLTPGSLEPRMGALDEHPEVGAACSATLVIDEENGTVRLEDPGSHDEPLSDRTLRGVPAFAIQSPMLRRTWFDRVGGFAEDDEIAEDLDLWLRLAQAGCRFEPVDAPPDRYLLHRGSRSHDALRTCHGNVLLFRQARRAGPTPEIRSFALGRIRRQTMLAGAILTHRGEPGAARRRFLAALAWARRPGHVLEALRCVAFPRSSLPFLSDVAPHMELDGNNA